MSRELDNKRKKKEKERRKTKTEERKNKQPILSTNLKELPEAVKCLYPDPLEFCVIGDGACCLNCLDSAGSSPGTQTREGLQHSFGRVQTVL